MKRLLKVLGLWLMLLTYLGIGAPLVDAFCVHNYTDIPLRIWSGPGATDPKFYVDSGKCNCCTQNLYSEGKGHKKYPKKLESKCTGPTYVTIAQAYTHLEAPFYYVEVQVPTHGLVIIKGQKDVSSMTFEVYDAVGNLVINGSGSVKLTLGNAPYTP